MGWIIFIVAILIFFLLFNNNHKELKQSPIKRSSINVDLTSFPNSDEFLVSGGNFSEYMYAILNFTNKYDLVKLIHEPTNVFDKDAIMVYCNDFQIGYVPSYYTSEISEIIKHNHIAYIDNIVKDGYISIKIKIKYS